MSPDEGKFISDGGLIKNKAAVEISEILIVAFLISVFMTTIYLA